MAVHNPHPRPHLLALDPQVTQPITQGVRYGLKKTNIQPFRYAIRRERREVFKQRRSRVADIVSARTRSDTKIVGLATQIRSRMPKCLFIGQESQTLLI